MPQKPPLKIRRSTKWPYILLPILVVICFILFVQNSYLKGYADRTTDQIEQLQKTLDQTKGQLNDIQRQQRENAQKLDSRGDSPVYNGGGNTSGSAAPTTFTPGGSNGTAPFQASPAQPGNQTGTGSTPQTGLPVTPRDPNKEPTILCNVLLPLICG